MSPLYRNLAITAAALAIPAVAAAVAGPDRVRRLPSQVRDLWHDDSVEGQLKRLSHRLEDLTENLDFHTSRSDTLGQVGRLAAIAGAVLLVPAALAAYFGPERIAKKARGLRDDMTGRDGWGTAAKRSMRDFGDDLEDLEDDLEEQRDDAFESVTARAKELRD